MTHDDEYGEANDGPTSGFVALLAFIATVAAAVIVYALWGQA